MISSRREARILLVQVLYEADFRGRVPNGASLFRTFNHLAQEHAPDLVDNPFAKQVLEGISVKYEDINAIIEQAAKNWSLDRIGIIDRNILRLGVFELLFGKDLEVPGRVALNEAIEVTKLFLSTNACKFVNGVLGAVYLEVKDPNEKEVLPKKMKHKKSVGGVVFRVQGDEAKFAFVHDIFNRWTLSKGGLEEGERPEEGFKRVILDEIGIAVEPVEKIGVNAYIAHPPEGPMRKEVIYFLGKTDEMDLNLKESGGLDATKWFDYEEAKQLTFYPDLKQIILDGMHKVVEQYL